MISRIEWVDFAKGISIILVVLHHVIERDVGNAYYSANLIWLNDTLKLLRMPLFFFLSGLFIYKGLSLNLKMFFEKKLKNLLFVYTIWNFVRYFFLIFVALLPLGIEMNLGGIISLYYDPPIYWFLYALVIFSALTYLFRNRMWLALTLSLIGYAVSISNGNHHDPTFFDEVLRYFPMYLIGYYFSKNFVLYSQWIKKKYVLLIPFYLFVVGVVLNSSLNNNAFIILSLMLLGIVLGISLAMTLTSLKYLGFMSFIGKHTLPIYILHVYPKQFFEIIFTKVGIESLTLYTILQFALALILPIVVYKIMEKTPLRVMFNVNSLSVNLTRTKPVINN